MVRIETSYEDLGEMMEKELFGGLIEAKSENPTFMSFEQVGLYASKHTKHGYYVNCLNSTFTPLYVAHSGWNLNQPLIRALQEQKTSQRRVFELCLHQML